MPEMPQRHERHGNRWRKAVAWVLQEPNILTDGERLFCEEMISRVLITDEQRITLSGIFGKAIGARGGIHPSRFRMTII
jgi:hypothetical protein